MKKYRNDKTFYKYQQDFAAAKWNLCEPVYFTVFYIFMIYVIKLKRT